MSASRATAHGLALCGALLAAQALHAQDAMDFEAAKAAADADEASLDAATREAAVQQQRAFLDAGVAACANPATTARLEPFVVVVELDADGHVTRTWRRGDSPLALCIERQSRGKAMFVPPRAPFRASLEVGFEP
jgi:hypothetical protein